MTDIVTRLRTGVYGMDRVALCAEAALEIEQLRIKIEALTKPRGKIHSCDITGCAVCDPPHNL